MSRKKVSTTIYITPEQAERLKLLHERTKVPVSVYIREGIDMMLKHYEHVLPGQMSLDAAVTFGAEPPPNPPPALVARGARASYPPSDEGRMEDELPEDAPRTLPGAAEAAAPRPPAASAPRGGQRAGANRQPGPPRSSGDGG